MRREMQCYRRYVCKNVSCIIQEAIGENIRRRADPLLLADNILSGGAMLIVKSLILFILAGLCEIGGGYFVWLWLREGKGIWVALLGAVVLVLYGVIPTFQPANFGRVYAAYGGIFVVLSILWGWKIDKIAPDRFDILGGLICLAGVFVIMYWPRG